jgi:tetratricopeptide (TPR) repeat protein
MSFLRLFAFSARGRPLQRPARDDAALEARLAQLETVHSYRFQDELIGWALLDLWSERQAAAQSKLAIARGRYPPTLDPVAHFAALRLADTRSQERAIEDGEELLEKHPRNRWMLLAQGYLLQESGRYADASARFENILMLPNQEPDFLDRLFKVWSWLALAQMSAVDDPDRARGYLQSILASGVSGGLRSDARQLMDSLDQPTRP